MTGDKFIGEGTREMEEIKKLRRKVEDLLRKKSRRSLS